MAGVIAIIPAAIAATSMRRRIYLRWVSGWIEGDSGAEPEAEWLLTEPLPGGVVGLVESDFSGVGFVSLVESGVRLTERAKPETTTWGAFWPDVIGYVVLPEVGTVRIEVSGCGYVQVETGSGVVQEHWETVLGMKGVPLSGS